MSEKYKFHDPEALYYTTTTVVCWIDLFTRKEYKYILINAIAFCQKEKGVVVHAYCIMPSHFHMIVSTKSNPLNEIFRDLKKYVTREIIKEIDVINESRREWLKRAFVQSGKDLKRITKHKIWQDGNHPVLLDNNIIVQEKIDYIHHNPVEGEIVDEPEYYWYSSARDYMGNKGLLDVSVIV